MIGSFRGERNMPKVKRALLCGIGLLCVAGPSQSGSGQHTNIQERHRFLVSSNPPAKSICMDCESPTGIAATNPPAHFDALAANAAELARYGFPPRPPFKTAPDAYAFWVKLVTLPVRRVVAKLEPTNIHSGPVAIVAEAPPGHGTTQAIGGNSAASVGYFVADADNPFRAPNTTVYGSFVVPLAQQAFGACTGDWDYSLIWVGIDDKTDVLQGGVEADALCSGGTSQSFYSAWYEWYPFDLVQMSTPVLAPGDLVYTYVWNTNRTTGNFYIADETQGTVSSVTFNAPPGTQLNGDGVEWVIERPTVNHVVAPLTNYIDVPWYGAMAVAPKRRHPQYSPGYAPTGRIFDTTMFVDGEPISRAYRTSNNNLNHTDQGGAVTDIPGSALWFFDEGAARQQQ